MVLANTWSGYLVNSNTGAPIANASVIFNNGAGTTTNASNASGFFNVSFSSGTQCVLSFSATGYYNDSNEPYNYSSTRFCPSSSIYNNMTDVFFNPAYFNFTLTPLNPGSLIITVKDASGNLLDNANVSIAGQYQTFSGLTANGSVVFSNLTDPTYNYTITLSNYSTGIGTASVVFNSTENISVTLYPSFLSNFTGFVSSSSGMVGGAVVNITDLNEYNSTSSNGQFAIQNVYPGTHSVSISASGYIQTTAVIDVPPSSSVVYMFYLSQNSNPTPTPNPTPSSGPSTYYGCNYNNPSCGSGYTCVNNACILVQTNKTNNTASNQTNQTQNNSNVQKQPPAAYVLTQNYVLNFSVGNNSYTVPVSRTIAVYTVNNSFITKVTLKIFNNQSAIIPDFYLREIIPFSNASLSSKPSIMVSGNEPEWLVSGLGGYSGSMITYTFNYYVPSQNLSSFASPQIIPAVEQFAPVNNTNATVSNSTSNSTKSNNLSGFATAFQSPIVLGAVALLAILIAVLAYLTLKPEETENETAEPEDKLQKIADEVKPKKKKK